MGKIDLLTALSKLADFAREYGQSPPVIYTDTGSALQLGRMIDDSLAGYTSQPRDRFGTHDPAADCVAMFDGVKIKVYNGDG